MSSSNTHSSKKRRRDDENKKGSFVPVQGEAIIPAPDLEEDDDIELVLFQIPSTVDMEQLATLPITDKLLSSNRSTSQIISLPSSSSSSSSSHLLPSLRIVTHPAEGQTLQGLQLNVLVPSSSSSGSSKESKVSSSTSATPPSNYRVLTRNFAKLIQIQQQNTQTNTVLTSTTSTSKSKSSSTPSPVTLANQTLIQPVQLMNRNKVPINATLAYRYRPIGSTTPSSATTVVKEKNSSNKTRLHY